MKKASYIGDARLRKLLDRYACPAPFHGVRAIMMGDIASPVFGSPTETIKMLWNGELPEFETEREAEAFFDALFGLWSHLTRHQKRSHPFRLVTAKAPSDREGLRDYARMRAEEVVSLLEGFTSDEEDLDLPPELAECVKFLEEAARMFGGATQMLEDQSIPSTDEELAKLRDNLAAVLDIANRESAQLVWLATDYRKQQIAAGPPRTVH